MNGCLAGVIGKWDGEKHACFSHCTKSEAVAATCKTIAGGVAAKIPDLVGVLDGFMIFYPLEEVEEMVSSRLLARNILKCKSWVVALPGIPPKKITSVMLNVSQTRDDPFLQTYAPEHALPGCLTLHFFDFEKAVSVLGPLMDVD